MVVKILGFYDGGTNGQLNMVIDGVNGNVGIGTSNPIQKLDVNGGINVEGNVGIGAATPSEKVVVDGNIYSATGDFYASGFNGVINCGGGIMDSMLNYIGDYQTYPANVNGDEDLYIQDDLQIGGAAFKPGGGSWSTASDARLKKDISPYDDGLKEVMKIKPVKFKYNSLSKMIDQEKEHIGILAQDMLNIAPYMVEEKAFWQKVREEDKEGNEIIIDQGQNYYTYDGSALNYMLVNAVQEQQSIIEKQNERIESLENPLQELIEK